MDERDDKSSFCQRLHEASTAFAAYSRQKWEGKKGRSDKALGLVILLNFYKAVEVPGDLLSPAEIFIRTLNA